MPQRDGLNTLTWAFGDADGTLGRARQLFGYLKAEMEWLQHSKPAVEQWCVANALRVRLDLASVSSPPCARELYDVAKAFATALGSLMAARHLDRYRSPAIRRLLTTNMGELAQDAGRAVLAWAQRARVSADIGTLGRRMTDQLKLWIAANSRMELSHVAQSIALRLQALAPAPPRPDIGSAGAENVRLLRVQLEATCLVLLAAGQEERYRANAQVLFASARIKCRGCGTSASGLTDWDRDFHALHRSLSQGRWLGFRATLYKSVHGFVQTKDHAARALQALSSLVFKVDEDIEARPERQRQRAQHAAAVRVDGAQTQAAMLSIGSRGAPHDPAAVEAAAVSDALRAHAAAAAVDDEAVRARWAAYCAAVSQALHRQGKVFMVCEVLNDYFQIALSASASILRHEASIMRALAHALSATVHAAEDAHRVMRHVQDRHEKRLGAQARPIEDTQAWQAHVRTVRRYRITIAILDAQQAAADRECRARTAFGEWRQRSEDDRQSDAGQQLLRESQQLHLDSAEAGWLAASRSEAWESNEGRQAPSNDRKNRLQNALNALALAEVSRRHATQSDVAAEQPDRRTSEDLSNR